MNNASFLTSFHKVYGSFLNFIIIKAFELTTWVKKPALLLLFLNNYELRVKGKFKAVGSNDLPQNLSYRVQGPNWFLSRMTFWGDLPSAAHREFYLEVRLTDGSSSLNWIRCGCASTWYGLCGPGALGTFLRRCIDSPSFHILGSFELVKPCD